MLKTSGSQKIENYATKTKPTATAAPITNTKPSPATGYLHGKMTPTLQIKQRMLSPNNMKMTYCLFALMLSISLITGCSSTTPTGSPSDKVWYRPDTTPEQTQHDLALSQYDAISNRRATSVYGNTVGQTILLRMVADNSEDSKESQMIAASMSAKGYTLIKKNSPPPKTPKIGVQVQKISPEIEAKLVGRWESVSFKTKIADKDQNAVDKQILVFFPSQRLLTETIYRNGKTEPRLNHYNINGDTIEMVDPTVVKPYTKITSRFSLIDDQMILTADNVQVILHKVSGTNTVPEIDNLLLGKWICNLKTNAIVSVTTFNILPQNRYSFQMAITAPQKNLNESEEGIYCYDAENQIIVSWTDKEAEPQWFKCYVVGNHMNLVEGKVTLGFTRESE